MYPNNSISFNFNTNLCIQKTTKRSLQMLIRLPSDHFTLPQVIIHDRKPRNGTYCKESIVKLLGENLQLADENVTLCLALGYQRVQRLPGENNLCTIILCIILKNNKKTSPTSIFRSVRLPNQISITGPKS